MDQTILSGPNPQTSVAVAQHSYAGNSRHRAWQRMNRFDASIKETRETPLHQDQERPIVVFRETKQPMSVVDRQPEELRHARLPSPEPVDRSRPEIALLVLVQSADVDTRTVVVVATCVVILHRAELPVKQIRPCPNGPVAILKHRVNPASIQF